MEAFLIYLGKTALATGAFYLAYLVLFQNRKLFGFNRIYLLTSLAVSFVIPLITFTVTREVRQSPIPVFYQTDGAPVITFVQDVKFQWEWYHYLLLIYSAGFIGFLLFLLAGHFKAINIIRESLKTILFGTAVRVSGKDIHPFSFFRNIVISRETLAHPNLSIIVEHEKIHVEEKHTIDILISEILFLLQWFNPFAWLVKDAVKNNLEYKTDHEVVKNHNPQIYQLAMLSLADKQGIAPFLTAFNGSQLKNRIVMMKKKTENRFAVVKQLLILPLLAVLVMGLSNREVNYKTIEITDYPASDKTVKGKVLNETGKELQGVAVLVKGKSIGTITDQNGNYKIKIDGNGESLVFYLPDFEKEEVEVNEQSEINVVLRAEKNVKQNEVKVIGYASPSKSQKIKTSESVNIVNKEDGKSGVQFSNIEGVVSNNGTMILTPQKDKKMVLAFHGDKSKKPLYFIEGKEVDDISNLNPDIIESVTVLKEESAVILYGEKAKNGVILIKTKNPLVPITVTGYPIKTDQKDPVSKNQSEPLTVIGYAAKQDAQDPVFFIVEEMPEFPGGEIALRKFISESIQYPAEAIKYGIQGKVYVTFIIGKTGKIRDPKTTKSFDPILSREALRVIGSMPDWKPGKQKGIPVNVSYTVPVNFVLPENKSSDINNSLKNKKLTINDITHSGKTFDGTQYVPVDKEPEFPGGWRALLMFIGKSVQYPQSALENKISGVVWISFIVDSDGKVKNPAVAESIDPALDKEALRIVRTLPKWEPGLLYGKPVDVYNGVPVRFTLPRESYMVPVKDSINVPKRPLYIVDGKEFTGNISEIPIDEIADIHVIKNPDFTHVSKYGDKIENGIIEIQTKTRYNSSSGEDPLVIVNGVVANKSMNDIDPNTIESVNILKGELATQKYGDKGKNGVINVTLKNKTDREIMLGSRNLAPGSVKVSAGGRELSENVDYTVDYTQGVIKVINKDLLKSGTPLSVSTESKDLFPGNRDENQEEQVFFIVEKMPEFPGNETGLRKFISDAIQYPEIAKENGISGKVYVTLVIDKTGKVKNPVIARGVDPSLDKEALRVVSSLPDWKPGLQRGKPVNVNYTIPVEFKLPPGLDGDNLDDLELRKTIAREIKYPRDAQEQNLVGTVRLWIDVDKNGKITGILDERPSGITIRIDEVVVVGYGLTPNKGKQTLSSASKQLLTDEVKRVLNKISYIQNRVLHGKTVQISVQFSLQ